MIQKKSVLFFQGCLKNSYEVKMKTIFDLTGKIAVITGSSKGIDGLWRRRWPVMGLL